MPIDPNIALSYKPVEIQPRNALAEAAQVMSLQQAQMQMDKLRRTDEAMERIRQTAIKNGGPGDLGEIANAFMQSPDLGHQELGLKIMQQQRDKADFEKMYSGMFGAPAAAPAAPTSSVNAMAPTAPAAPVNAMAPGATPTVDSLRQQIMMFSTSSDPRAKAMVDVLKGQLGEMTKTQSVAPGHQVYRGGQVVYTAPAAPTELDRLIAARDALPAGDPRRAIYSDKIKKETTHQPAPTMVNVMEKAESGAFGKLLVDQFDTVSKAAGLAAKTLPAIEANLGALNQGMETGFGTEAKAAGARILGALGVQNAEKFATDTQTFQSNAMQALMQKQLEQKGPQTEFDATRIEQMGAQLGKTKDANRFILDVAKEQLKRDIDQRNFYAKWQEKTGSFKGAENAWYEGAGGKSLFDRPALKKYMSSQPAASAADQIPGQSRPTAAPAKTVVRTGKLGNRRVVQYSDGSTEYAD